MAENPALGGSSRKNESYHSAKAGANEIRIPHRLRFVGHRKVGHHKQESRQCLTSKTTRAFLPQLLSFS